MKAMKVITIVCWFIVAAVLLGFAVWFLTGTVFGAGSERWNNIMPLSFNFNGIESLTGPYEIVGTYDFETSGLDSINVDWIAGGVTIKPHDGEKIQLTEYAQRRLNDDEKLHTIVSGETLTIRFREKTRGAMINFPQKKLEVLIPRELIGEMNRLAVETVSGSIDAESVTADFIKLNSISGNITLSYSTANDLKADSTSGRINVSAVTANDMGVNSISGAIRVSESSARAIDCDSTSGSVDVSGEFGRVKLNSISGRIELDNQEQSSTVIADSTSGTLQLSGSFESVKADTMSGSISVKSTLVPSSLKADSVSGRITVAVPNEGPITVHSSTTSGHFSSDIPIVMQNQGAQFELSTMSGRISIIVLS